MSRKVRWSHFAADRLEAAAVYFESKREGAGYRFIDDVEAAIGRAAHAPMSYPGVPGEPDSIRRLVLPRFGYWMIYEVQADAIVILTLWSAAQKPGSWRSEIDEGNT